MAAPPVKVARPETDEPVVPCPPPRPPRDLRALLRWTPRVEQAGAVAVVVIVLLPLLGAAYPLLQALDEGHRTMGDSALLELGVRRFGHEPLLLGPYSRFGWSHPGPAPFVALAPVYWLTGGNSLGLGLAALAVNAASIVGIAVLAWKRGGAPLLAWALVLVALLVRLVGAEVVQNPWNPYLAMLPLALLVLLTWSVACGSRWSLPVAVGVGSAIVQTHIGYAPAVGALLLGSVVLLVLRGRRGLGRPLLVAVVVGAVLWAPAALEELANDPGNLSALREYADSERETPGLERGAELASAQLGRLPASVAGDEQGEAAGLAASGPLWPTAVSAGALATAAVVAWRRRLPDVLRLLPLVLLFGAASVLAASSIDREPYAYLVQWMAVGGFALWLAVAAHVAATALACAVSFGEAGAAVDTPVPEAERSAVVAKLVAPLEAALPPGDCPVLVRWSGDVGWAWGAGVVLALEEEGRDVRVSPPWEFMFGERAIRDVPPESPVLTVVAPNGRGTGPVVSSTRALRVHRAGGSCEAA